MRKLRVGIIGTGMAFERLHYPAYQQLSDRYEIVALADVDRDKAANWAKRLNIAQEHVYTDYREMVTREDIDVADIMVPIEQNYAVTKAVAERLAGKRKGIICEKPLAANMAEAKNARELAQEYQIPIMIAENYRYNQEIDMIRDMVRAKRVGDIHYFMWNRVVNFPAEMVQNTFPAKEWRQYPDFPGGAFTDIGVHDVAGLRHIFGAIEKLHAFGRPERAQFSPYSVINVNFLFKNGITGQYSFFCAGPEMQRPLIGLRIFGTEGMIYLEDRDVGTINLAFNNGQAEQIPYEVQKGFYNELLNFHNALMGTEPISVTPELEYGDFKTIQDILRSIEENTIVSVDAVEEYRPDYEHPAAERRLYH